MDHEILEAGIFGFDRLDTLDHLLGSTAEPRLLLHPLAQGRDARRRAGAAPGATVLVGVADKAERREPFVALVMRRFEAADRLFLAVGEIDAGAPDHVLAERSIAAVFLTRLVESLHHVVEDL